MRRLPSIAAIALGHFAFLLIGLLFWCTERPDALHAIFVTGDPHPHDFKHLIKYGISGTLIPAAVVYLMSWWTARKGGLPFIAALAGYSRQLWPALLGLIALLGIFIPATAKDVFGLLLLSVTGLLIVFLSWQYMAFHGRAGTACGPGGFRRWRTAAIVVAVLCFAWFGTLSCLRHYTMNTGLHDAGIYDQIAWNTINGRPFECAMFRLEMIGYEIHRFDNHFFAEHFIPSFLLAIPLYWLFPSMTTLLLIQAFLLASAAIPAFLIAWKKLESGVLAFLMTMAMMIHPLVQQSYLADEHVDTFALPFLLGAFAALLYGRHVLYWVLLVVALGCKQEISVNVALMGIFLLLSGREHRKTAIATFIVGMIWFVISTQVIIPHYRHGLPLRQFDRYAHFIPAQEWTPDMVVTPGHVVKAMLKYPSHAAGIILDPIRFRSVLLIIAPFFFFMIFQWKAWLWLLPLTAIHVLAKYDNQYALQSYYGITLIPAAFVGSVYGAANLLKTDGFTQKPRGRTALKAGMIFVLLAIWRFYGFLPFGESFGVRHYESDPHEDIIRDFIKDIPPDANVTAQSRLGAQLAQRRYIYNFPQIVTGEPGETEYIFLDTRGPAWPFLQDDRLYMWEVRRLLMSNEWGLVRPAEDGVLLFRRGHPAAEHRIHFRRLEYGRYRGSRP